MEEEIKDLKLEIEVLKQRISDLESKERTRTIFKVIKYIIIVVIIVLLIIYGYKFYTDFMKYYNEIKGVMDNPLKQFIN